VLVTEYGDIRNRVDEVLDLVEPIGVRVVVAVVDPGYIGHRLRVCSIDTVAVHRSVGIESEWSSAA
jgi:hypothetical protein